jgi:hypothetical protein
MLLPLIANFGVGLLAYARVKLYAFGVARE